MNNKTIFLGIILLMSALVFTYVDQVQNTNDYSFKKISIDVKGGTLSGLYLKPKGIILKGSLPGVIIFHGLSASKEMMRVYAETLVRNGFAVLLVDLPGHGSTSLNLFSQASLPQEKIGNDVVNYFINQPEVNQSEIGIIGHSLGASFALSTALHNKIIKSTIILGDSLVYLKGNLIIGKLLGNSTSPPNLLVEIGIYDEFFTPTMTQNHLEQISGKTIEIGKMYGNFMNGTARELIIDSTDHLFEVSNNYFIQKGLDWMKSSFNFNSNISEKNIGFEIFYTQLISLLAGLIWLLIPIVIINKFKFTIAYSFKNFSFYLQGVVSFIAFLIGTFLIFSLPVLFFGLFATWFVLSAIGYILILLKRNNITLNSLITEFKNQTDKKSVELGLIAFFIIFIPVQLILSVTPWDFRFTIPILTFLPLNRYLFFIILWVLSFLFFSLEYYSYGDLKEINVSIKNFFKIYFSKVWPFAIFLVLCYTILFTLGSDFLPANITFSLFFISWILIIMLYSALITLLGKKKQISLVTVGIFLSGLSSWIIICSLPIL